MNTPRADRNARTYVLLSSAVALLVGAAGWVSTVGAFVVWLADKEGKRSYAIPDLLFRTNAAWRDALVAGGASLVLAAVAFALTFAVARSKTRSTRVGFFIQLLVGSAYIFLMLMSTKGLWSVSGGPT
jgi:hypothetical protein